MHLSSWECFVHVHVQVYIGGNQKTHGIPFVFFFFFNQIITKKLAFLIFFYYCSLNMFRSLSDIEITYLSEKTNPTSL